eukprot:TRINITY_DN1115_c0_g1_i2.p1 TRINITY_DN1115_c0_g1~~TRINITY_DN1115_c0_g1_i2.p1  ORF type:complete len:422 (-),score=62.91 TRINITY_DN1115_c0_g1_i2:38-1303(-)
MCIRDSALRESNTLNSQAMQEEIDDFSQFKNTRRLSSQNEQTVANTGAKTGSNRKQPAVHTINLEKVNDDQVKDIVTLLRRLGEAYFNMSMFLCQEAIDLFLKLPKNQLRTGWTLTNIGKCYMDCIKYQEAEKYFAEAYSIEPYRSEGVEYYSTCLWHLKKNVEATKLASDLLAKAFFSPETWVAVGNCFSMQKEHENALKFFHRALQLNPSFSYAYTLCGHEYAYNEDFVKARKYYDQAIALDLRHYNAWWGLGNIFYKQEKYDRALDNFLKAISINHRCPVLYSYLGMTLFAKGEFAEALRYFDNSEMLDPNNYLNRFQKANVLVKLDRLEQALKELEKLRQQIPKEAPIPILMGKIYKKLGRTDKALYFFNIALDLDQRDQQKIKALIESLYQTHEFTEDLDTLQCCLLYTSPSPRDS